MSTPHDADSTDGIFDFLENLTSRLQKDFDDLIGECSDKKSFVKALTRIFALLLNTKVNTADKIKRILRIAVKTTLIIWQGPNNSSSRGRPAPVLASTSE